MAVCALRPDRSWSRAASSGRPVCRNRRARQSATLMTDPATVAALIDEAGARLGRRFPPTAVLSRNKRENGA